MLLLQVELFSELTIVNYVVSEHFSEGLLLTRRHFPLVLVTAL